MRIVGGRHRGRPLAAPPGLAVRPTSDRAREALFNILAHARGGADGAPLLAGARVVDLFCGTGALGLEALSRGAAHATLIDDDPAALEAARANARRLGETARVTVQAGDARHLPRPRAPCRVAFLDPPYGSGFAEPALATLARRGWLADGAVAVVELGAKERFAPPEGFTVRDERRYGRARLVFLRHGRG